MSSQLFIHPRGFCRVVSSTGIANQIDMDSSKQVWTPQVIDEDREIESLMRRYLGGNDYVDWAVRRNELHTCAFTYGDFANWVDIQLTKNPYVYDMSLDFLLDTLCFIATGERKMKPNNWKELLEIRPVVRPSSASQSRALQLPDSIRNAIDWDNAINQWVSQPNGHDDLVFSTYVFFGKL